MLLIRNCFQFSFRKECDCDVTTRMPENAPLEIAILKIFICYTLPLTKDATCYGNMRQGQLKFLDAFIQQVGLFLYVWNRMHFSHW